MKWPFFLLITLLGNLSHSHGFFTTISKSRTNPASRCLHSAKSSRSRNWDDDNDDNDDGNDSLPQQYPYYELERQRLENFLNMDNNADTDGTDSVSDYALLDLPYHQWQSRLPATPPPPLTSAGRQRLELEISLLQSLAASDTAVSQLWNLWYTSRGPGPAKELIQMEALPRAEQTEKSLRELIAREGLYWSQPIKRLATVCFLQKRFQEASILNQLVVATKPWDFSALKGIVLASRAMEDAEAEAKWSKKRMPPLGPERKLWVNEMVQLAQARLLDGETGIKESFRHCDEQTYDESGETNDASWQ